MADSVVTLRPNSTRTDPGGPVRGYTVHAGTSDDLDTTHVKCDSVGGGDGYGRVMRVGLTTAVIAGDIRGIRVRYRLRIGIVYERVIPGEGYLNLVTGTNQSGSSTISDKTGTTFATRGGGGPWTQADVDALEVEILADSASVSEVYEIWVDVFYNAAPVVTVVALADEDTNTAGVQVISTATPTITHTYTDPESDVQERKRVKVFSDAQYLAGGFDPSTSTAVWDSGEVFSSSTSTVVGTALEVDTYRAYVQAADAGSSGRYSAWAFTEFAIALDPLVAPNAPALTATAVGGRVDLLVTPQGSNPTEFILVEYLRADGTWGFVRGAERVLTSTAVTVVDYEAEPNVATSYRAKAGVAAVNGDVFSPASTTRTATITITETVLLDPLDPPGAVVLTLQPTSNEENEVISMQGRSGVFKALGREDLVTVSDVMDADEWPFIAIVAAADWLAVESLIRSQQVLLLREPGQQRYCRLADDVTVSELRSPGAERRVRTTARGKPRP